MDEYDLSNLQTIREQLQPSISYMLVRMEALMQYRAQMVQQFGEQETHQLISHVHRQLHEMEERRCHRL